MVRVLLYYIIPNHLGLFHQCLDCTYNNQTRKQQDKHPCSILVWKCLVPKASIYQVMLWGSFFCRFGCSFLKLKVGNNFLPVLKVKVLPTWVFDLGKGDYLTT